MVHKVRISVRWDLNGFHCFFLIPDYGLCIWYCVLMLDRFPSLGLLERKKRGGGCFLCWTRCDFGASCRAGAGPPAVTGPSSRRGTLQVQQHPLCRTASSQACQHRSQLLKSTKSRFSRSFLVHFLGGVPFCLRMPFFLIPLDCSLETFPHAFPQQLYTVACLCSSARAFRIEDFPFLSLQK